MSRIVIIGGGIAGLASAGLLAREGHDATLLEARPEVGGRAGNWERDGFRFDTGPSWYLRPEVFDHFYKLLGTTANEQLNLITLDPGYRVYFEGEDAPLDVAAEVEDNIDLFERIEPGAGEKLARYLESAEETYELAKRRFLYTTYADFRPLLRSDVLSRTAKFLRLLIQPLSSFVSGEFRDRRLQQLLGYPAVFLGSSPYLTPSMYHLMSHLDLSDGVLYPMGGFTRVIETIADLATAQGARIVTGADVTRIVVENDVATGVEYVDASGAVQFEDADIVVSAADLHHTETQLLGAEHQSFPQEYWDARTPGPSALLLYLGVEGQAHSETASVALKPPCTLLVPQGWRSRIRIRIGRTKLHGPDWEGRKLDVIRRASKEVVPHIHRAQRARRYRSGFGHGRPQHGGNIC